MTADSPSKVYGAAVPALTYTYPGLVNGDTPSSSSGALTTTAYGGERTSAATSISQGTLAAGGNYRSASPPAR